MSSRLYRALVDTGLAVRVTSNYDLRIDPSLFTLEATVKDGVPPSRVEDALLREVERIKTHPVSDQELATALNQARARLAYDTDGAAHQAFLLGYFEVVSSFRLLDTLPAALVRVTPADLTRVAETSLGEDQRSICHYLAKGGA